MLAKLRSRIRRPRPATVIAFVALVFAMGGGAVAKQINQDEVTTVTTTGGPVQTSDPGEGTGQFDQDDIPLGNDTFTQKAGEVLLVSVEADVDRASQQQHGCDLIVSVMTPGFEKLGFELQYLAQRGDPTTKLGDSQALPAPAADRQITLSATAAEVDIPEPFEEEGFAECDEETFTVALRVSVTTLRN